jgi:hypothetical protein
MKYTPGPWRILPEYHTAINSGKKHIAMVNFFKSSDKETCVDEEEHKANAQLIHASPDLLEACKETVNTIEMIAIGYLNGDIKDIVMGEVQRLHAVITKAEGGDNMH